MKGGKYAIRRLCDAASFAGVTSIGFSAPMREFESLFITLLRHAFCSEFHSDNNIEEVTRLHKIGGTIFKAITIL